MKTRLKPRMFPEAGECLHDDRGLEEQMADLGVGIIRRKKEEVQVTDLGFGIIRRKKEEVQVTDNKKTIEKLLDEKGRCACETVPKPLLDITDTGIVLAPLAAGVSKMLERIGEGQCRLIITVERV